MKIEKMIPTCKDYLWGGNKLKEKYGKQTDFTPCAESWELSYHKDGLTRLSDGRTLAQAFSADELGENVKEFEFFPMLIKFIDACDNLSIQVHPSDEYALENENSFGKTEMWYVVEADEGAGLYVGFKNAVSQEEYEAAIKENRLTDLLNFYEVKSGETYFIPSGTVHAIGKGCLICEIQQNSNLTYRVYDYGRVDKNGKPRELHIDKALKVSDLTAYSPKNLNASTEEGELLGISKYFTVSRLSVEGPRVLKCDKGSFRCVTCVAGEGSLGEKQIRLGDSYFISASDESVDLDGKMILIVSSVRRYRVETDTANAKIVDDLGNIVASAKTIENESRKALVKRLLSKSGIALFDVDDKTIE